MKNYFKEDKRVLKAYLFGSYARNEERPDSDLDVMIEMADDGQLTLKDFAEIRHDLEKILKKNVDLVEKGYIKPMAWLTVKNDLILIYESGKSN
jgi:predicted nucleotidyltransferase